MVLALERANGLSPFIRRRVTSDDETAQTLISEKLLACHRTMNRGTEYNRSLIPAESTLGKIDENLRPRSVATETLQIALSVISTRGGIINCRSGLEVNRNKSRIGKIPVSDEVGNRISVTLGVDVDLRVVEHGSKPMIGCNNVRGASRGCRQSKERRCAYCRAAR